MVKPDTESLFFIHEFQQCDPRFCPFCNRITKPRQDTQPICRVPEWGVDPNGRNL